MAYENMSGPDLIRAFNEMAAVLNVKTVSRFSDMLAGRRRCEALASRLRARESGLAEDDATPAPRARKAKAKKAKAATPAGDIFAQFKTNTGKNRGKLLSRLNDDLGQQVPLTQLVRAVYGNQKEENFGALKMVLRGLELSIKKDRLEYEIRKTKIETTGGLAYGLYRKT